MQVWSDTINTYQYTSATLKYQKLLLSSTTYVILTTKWLNWSKEQVTPPGPMRILPTDFGTMNFSTIFEFLELASLKGMGRSRPPIEDDRDIHKIDF